MKKWYVISGTITVSAWTYIYAESKEAAMSLASDRTGELCPHGWKQDGGSPLDNAIVEEGDGYLVPTEVRLASPEELKEIRDVDDPT